MGFTLTELNEQLSGYKNQLNQSHVLQQQIQGAITAIEHQVKLLIEKEIQAQIKLAGEQANATQERIEQENNTIEHQDGNSSREETEPSSSDCLLESGENQHPE